MNKKPKTNKKREYKDYCADDFVAVARSLKDCHNHSYIDNSYTIARIVKTKACSDSCDRAS